MMVPGVPAGLFPLALRERGLGGEGRTAEMLTC